jgi:tetratricopeptide (TPR) repeat protein
MQMLLEEKRCEQSPQITELRQAMAEQILRFAQNCLDVTSSDPSERLETGLAHMLVANVYRVKGELVKCQEALGRAIALFEQLVREYPEEDGYRQELAVASSTLGLAFDDAGKTSEAAKQYELAAEYYRQSITASRSPKRALNNYAWFLTTCPQARFRDPAKAVEMAEQAVRPYPCGLEVSDPAYWNTLGVARYRTADYGGAIQALKKSMKLHNGGDSIDWFFLAMSLWHLGDKEQALHWYKRATNNTNPYAEDISRYHAEAAALLGVTTTSCRQGERFLPLID